MENKTPNSKVESSNQETKSESISLDISKTTDLGKKVTNQGKKSEPEITNKNVPDKATNLDLTSDTKKVVPKKPPKPPKIEEKPFKEFVTNHFIPGLKSSIEQKGIVVSDIKLIEGKRPVVGGNCWMVFCEISDQRRFWLCFNKELITSDKTILLAESNSDPSIVESFLIDEKKTTLPLLISRVLQRLNGQKWIGAN